MSRGEGGAADGPVGNMTDEERLLYLRSDRWIGYPRAEAILDQLDRLLAFPRNVRMPGLLVLGESGIGKTMIVDRFCRMHPQQVKAAPRGTTMPVVSVQGSRFRRRPQIACSGWHFCARSGRFFHRASRPPKP